jgi:hypothetical protein
MGHSEEKMRHDDIMMNVKELVWVELTEGLVLDNNIAESCGSVTKQFIRQT